MSQGEELLDSLTENEAVVTTVDPSTEPHIVINSDRTITVPAELKRIAVQYDHNIETVTFDCPRYWDEHDMSTMNVHINYLRPDGVMDSYIVPDDAVTIDESDDSIMHFTWTISRNVTEAKGNLSVLVCIKKADAEGVETNHWNSELCRDMYISEGMEVDPWSETHSDLIAGLLTRMEELEIIGLSTTVDISEIPCGHRVTITTSSGVKTFEVMNGVNFTPHVDENGDLSWTNDQGVDNPETVNVKGPKGDQGEIGSILQKINLTDGSATVDPLQKYRIKTGPDTAKVFQADVTLPERFVVSCTATVGTKIYIFGFKYNNPGYTSPIYVYDTETKTLTTLVATYPELVDGVCAAVLGNKIYLFGGEYVENPYTYSEKIYRFDIETETFDSYVTTMSRAYGYMSAVTVGDKIYLFGGETRVSVVGSDTTVMSTTNVFTYDPEYYGFQVHSADLKHNVMCINAVAIGTKIYLFGGYRFSYNMTQSTVSYAQHNDIQVFDTENETIVTLDVTFPTASSQGRAVAIGNNIYSFGGAIRNYESETQYFDTINLFNTETQKLTTLNVTIPVAADSFSVATVGLRAYLVGQPSDTITVFSTETVQCEVKLEYSGGTYTFPLDVYDEYLTYFIFEILGLKVNSDGTEMKIAYAANGIRTNVTVTGTNIVKDDCVLNISSAEEVFMYNTFVGEEFELIEATTAEIEAIFDEEEE